MSGQGEAVRATDSDLLDEQFLAQLRRQMVQFARMQLQDESLAEDAVQEALIGALQNAGSFARRAAVKTWVFAILKNKIVDIIRQRARMAEGVSLPGEDDDPGERLFDQSGHWNKEDRPNRWAEPDTAVKNEHFWRVFEVCLDGLPVKQARLFMMREFLELESDEICGSLEVSTSNLHVMLFRARLRLRECLDKRWFQEGER